MSRLKRSLGIHSRLRRGTAALHQRLEQQLDLLGPELSIPGYVRTLRTFYGFYAPVEARLARLAPTAPSLGVPLRARAALLERDLIALGTPPSAIAGLPRCARLPRLSRPEHFAGCLYVLEGASLGGRIVARALDERLGLTQDRGAAFFAGDADATAERWKRVLLWLDQFACPSTRADDIVASACDTFDALSSWARLQGALP
jgi:heme oxygenase